MKNFKRIVAIILVVFLLFSITSLTIYSDTLCVSNIFDKGDGTINNPYQVSTIEHLKAINQDLTAHYIQTADIDLNGVLMAPIGSDNRPFLGSYNGQGFSIRDFTSCLFNGINNIGLFAFNKGKISNIILENVQIHDFSPSTKYGDILYYIGGIVGVNEGEINHCWVTLGEIETWFKHDGKIYGFDSGAILYVGGIAGYNIGKIDNCINDVLIDIKSSQYAYLGGISGGNDGKILNSLNTGEIFGYCQMGDYAGIWQMICYAGGISPYGEIFNCYSTARNVVAKTSFSYDPNIIAIQHIKTAADFIGGGYSSSKNNYALKSTYVFEGRTHHAYSDTIKTEEHGVTLLEESTLKELWNDYLFEFCDHQYGLSCNPVCKFCGFKRNVSHSFDAATCTKPKTCKFCGITSGNALDHIFDNSCDKTCNLCEEARIINHTYSYDCDSICNICGEKRNTIHTYADATCTKPKTCRICGITYGEKLNHTYDNACDKNCNSCGQLREVSSHVYDNACDARCNICADLREISHDYQWVIDKPANCGTIGQKHQRCTICTSRKNNNTIILATGKHVYDDACDANCNVCDFQREVSPHVYDNDCDNACNNCGKKRQVSAHKYFLTYIVDETNHWRECSICKMKANESEHNFSSDCDNYCNICNFKREVFDHIFDSICDDECNACGNKRNVAGHQFINIIDKSCNVCGAEREVKGQHLIKENGATYYYVDGEKSNITSLVKINGKWHYIKNGKFAKDATTLVKYNGKWYHVKNGLKTTATTLVKYNDKWYYVEKGVKTTKTTLVKYNGVWYYVKDGKKNTSTTLVKYNGVWYYVKSGKKSTATTLCKYNGNYYYVKSGKKNTATTIVKYNGKKYYVKKGIAQTSFSGKVKVGGKTYTVKKGIVK